MGVILQAFYKDCPRLENQEFNWWNVITTKLPDLNAAGFTALWLPPACKAANIDGMSMGYDPYDYYDLGDIDQRSSVKTWYGSKEELLSLITIAHESSIHVYADMVLNHTSGADAQELNPLINMQRWTKYTPKSGRFERDWLSYHPSLFERWDNNVYEDMPDLCHRNPYVYNELLEYARWLIEEIGFDGFRYDFSKGYGAWLVTGILERFYIKGDNKLYSPFGVGEYWDSDTYITDWLQQTNAFSDNPVSVFDFPLRYRLKSLCDDAHFSLRTLTQPGTLVTDGQGLYAVTFVENHDIADSDPIINDKMLAYAYILTHEGYPCVFWQDYYTYDLAQSENNSGIVALVKAHEAYAGGATNILYCDDALYIMERKGHQTQEGLIFVLNNSDQWNGTMIQTQWMNTNFNPVAWRGKDNIDIPRAEETDDFGNGEFSAPPRGYVVYVPAH